MPKVMLLQGFRCPESTDEETRARMHATHIALQWLAKRWPRAFPRDTRDLHPLAIGVHEEILQGAKDEPDAPPPEILHRTVVIWTRSMPYVTAASQGKDRIHLDGSVASPIKPSHQRYAKKVMEERKNKHAQAKRAPAPASPPLPAPAPAPKATTRPVIKLRRASA